MNYAKTRTMTMRRQDHNDDHDAPRPNDENEGCNDGDDPLLVADGKGMKSSLE